MKRNWIIGTRGSKLALRQTHIVIDELSRHHPDHDFTIKTIKTTGDTVWDKPLHLIDGQGLFVKEIEEALLRNEIDMAVHSVKDLPAELAEGLHLEAILKREDPRDAFISETYAGFNELRPGARIGTGSLRRRAQIFQCNESLEIVPLRGNIDTRLKKLQTEHLDGIMLAGAGLKRMGLEGQITQLMAIDIMTPSCGQGAIGIETRDGEQTVELLAPLNDEKSFREVSIERALLKLIGGGCHLPLGLHAAITGSMVTLYVSVGKQTGGLAIHEHSAGTIEEAPSLVSEAFNRVKAFLA